MLMNWNWNNFSSEIKDALLNSIVHLSTLNLDKILSLMDLTEVPISFYYDIRVVFHLQVTGRLGSPNLGLVHSTHHDGSNVVITCGQATRNLK
jgi:hypothetical protein